MSRNIRRIIRSRESGLFKVQVFQTKRQSFHFTPKTGWWDIGADDYSVVCYVFPVLREALDVMKRENIYKSKWDSEFVEDKWEPVEVSM